MSGELVYSSAIFASTCTESLNISTLLLTQKLTQLCGPMVWLNSVAQQCGSTVWLNRVADSMAQPCGSTQWLNPMAQPCGSIQQSVSADS